MVSSYKCEGENSTYITYDITPIGKLVMSRPKSATPDGAMNDRDICTYGIGDVTGKQENELIDRRGSCPECEMNIKQQRLLSTIY